MKTAPHRESVIEEVTRIYDMAAQLQTLLQYNSPCGAGELSEELLQSLTAVLSILSPIKGQLLSFQHPEPTKLSSSCPSSSIKTKVKEGSSTITKSDVLNNCNPSGNSCSRKTILTYSPYYDGHEWRKYKVTNFQDTGWKFMSELYYWDNNWNLKVTINNVHIRYEDSVSNPGHPFCSGITLLKLAVDTMDEKGNETFDTSGALDKQRKMVKMLDIFAQYLSLR